MTRPELYGDLTRWQGNPIKKDISGKKTKKNRHCDVIKQQISTRIFLTYQCYQVSKRVIKIIFLKKLFKNIFK
jgi:ubiquitin